MQAPSSKIGNNFFNPEKELSESLGKKKSFTSLLLPCIHDSKQQQSSKKLKQQFHMLSSNVGGRPHDWPGACDEFSPQKQRP
jgi:hypothetical protein